MGDAQFLPHRHEGQVLMKSTRRRRAFTLIEIAAVVAIIALLTAMAIPRLERSIVRQRVEAAGRRVAADLNYARERAVHTSTAVKVLVNADARAYTLAGLSRTDRSDQAYAVDLTEPPYVIETVEVSFDGGAVVTFNGFGHPSSGGTIRLKAGAQTETVTLDAMTGIATVGE